MSDQIARESLMRMSLKPMAIAPHAADIFATSMQLLAAADPKTEQQKFMEHRRAELCAAYGFEGRPQNKPFAFAEGLAFIPVSGTLINRFGASYSFLTGYNFIKQQTAQALADPDVKGIVYDHNSYGGEAAGCFECADVIHAAGELKPTLAVIDSNCYSASFALASAARRIVITPSGGVGSVGVVAMHVDMSKMLDQIGVSVTFVHAGAHKVDGNPYEPLPDDVKKNMQVSVDKSYARFVGTVARNRSMDDKAVRDTEARIYSADDGLTVGFVDALASPEEAVQAFFSELSGSGQQEKDNAMSGQANNAGAAANNAGAATQENTTAAAAPVANASGERARIKGITTCEGAKGHDNLANHLAFDTELSVEQSSAILAAAALDKPQAAAPAVREGAEKPGANQGQQAKPNAFEQAMDATGNPNVGTDAAAGAASEKPNRVDGILAAQQAATGRKPRTV